MTRLTAAFARGRALVAFVTAGDGDTAAILDALVAGGADVIELGMPFTDPMADGPAIQAANLRSLAKSTTTADVFALARGFRARHPDTPLVLMGYANPMVRRGADWFAAQCADAGIDGVICVDIPVEEDAALGPALRAAGVAVIRLATPTTDAARLPAVLAGADGFLYYVSVAGITGLQQATATSIAAAVRDLFATIDGADELDDALRLHRRQPVLGLPDELRLPDEDRQHGRCADHHVFGRDDGGPLVAGHLGESLQAA